MRTSSSKEVKRAGKSSQLGLENKSGVRHYGKCNAYLMTCQSMGRTTEASMTAFPEYKSQGQGLTAPKTVVYIIVTKCFNKERPRKIRMAWAKTVIDNNESSGCKQSRHCLQQIDT